MISSFLAILLPARSHGIGRPTALVLPLGAMINVSSQETRDGHFVPQTVRLTRRLASTAAAPRTHLRFIYSKLNDETNNAINSWNFGGTDVRYELGSIL